MEVLPSDNNDPNSHRSTDRNSGWPLTDGHPHGKFA
jgi:hypothetical protein